MHSKKRSGHLTIEPPIRESDAAEVGALVDFYSDRAVAHASFFIASIFGILTFLALVSNLEKINGFYYFVSILLFAGFSYMGYFTLVRFGYYASLSDYLTQYSLRCKDIFERYAYSKEHFESEVRNQKYILLPKLLLSKLENKAGLFLYLVYWVGIFLSGVVAFHQFWTSDYNSILYWLYWWLISVIPILFLTVPGVLVIYRENRRKKKEEEKAKSASDSANC
jgi:hypothetical protein